MRFAIWCSIFLLFGAIGGGARADGGTAKRAALEAQLSASLARVAVDLTDLVDKPNSTGVDDALAQIVPMQHALDDLATAVAGDDRAQHMIDEWPNWVLRLKFSLTALKRLKDSQHGYDGVPAECRRDEGELHDRMRAAIAHPDKADAAIADLREHGKTLAKQWQKRLQDLDDYDDRGDTDSAGGMAADEGDWRPVNNALIRDANALWEIRSAGEWHKRVSCDRIFDSDLPDVTLAIDELHTPRAKVDRAWSDVKQDYDDWTATKADILHKHVAALEQARTEICDDYEQLIDTRVTGQVQEIVRLHGAEAVLLGRADLMLAQLAKLEHDDAIAKDVKALEGKITRARGRLEAAAKQGLQTFDDPKIHAASWAGRLKHAEMRKKCSATNVDISGGNVQLDCVDVTGTAPHATCKVVMIEPNNDNATRAGESKGNEYQDWLAHAHAKDFKDGSPFLKCLADDNTLKLADVEVRTYDACPKLEDLAAFDPATVASDD